MLLLSPLLANGLPDFNILGVHGPDCVELIRIAAGAGCPRRYGFAGYAGGVVQQSFVDGEAS